MTHSQILVDATYSIMIEMIDYLATLLVGVVVRFPSFYFLVLLFVTNKLLIWLGL